MHGKEFKTRVVAKNGLRPRWNQQLELLASHPELAMLHVEVRSQQLPSRPPLHTPSPPPLPQPG